MLNLLRKEWPILLGIVTLIGIWSSPVPVQDIPHTGLVALVLFAITLTCVFRVTYHADELAEILGEPYGTLILTLSATIIEVAIMVTVLGHAGGNPTFVRDTIAATVMVTVGLMLGLAMFIGAFVHRQQMANTEGALTYLGLIVPLSILVLVLPNFTETTIGPTLALSQELFIAVVALLLYAIFLFIQTRRHRKLFRDPTAPERMTFDAGEKHPAQKMQPHQRLRHLAWLLFSLLLVVLLAEEMAIVIDDLLEEHSLPDQLGGLTVAMLILAPECLASFNAAYRNRLQRAVNIALGSGLATLSLSVPAILIIVSLLGHTIELGLPPREMIMLLSTLWVANIALATRRTNLMQGTVLLVLFLTYAFLILVP